MRIKMTIATLTSKGQITIPQNIRIFLDLHPQDQIEFRITENRQVILTPHTIEVTELKGFLFKPKKTVSLEQMDAAIKKRGAQL